MAAASFTAKTVRRLQRSRDRWKQRAAAKQRELRKLRCTVRDLTLSRDRWKEGSRQAHAAAALPTPVVLPLATAPRETGLGG